jgi:hypothetical protein
MEGCSLRQARRPSARVRSAGQAGAHGGTKRDMAARLSFSRLGDNWQGAGEIGAL